MRSEESENGEGLLRGSHLGNSIQLGTTSRNDLDSESKTPQTMHSCQAPAKRRPSPSTETITLLMSHCDRIHTTRPSRSLMRLLLAQEQSSLIPIKAARWYLQSNSIQRTRSGLEHVPLECAQALTRHRATFRHSLRPRPWPGENHRATRGRKERPDARMCG